MTAPPPRPAQGGRAAAAAIRRAAALACLVRDEGTDGIGAFLDDLDTDQLYALTVALAAMVDPDVDVPEDRLAWVTPIGVDLERAQQRDRLARLRQDTAA